MCINTKFELKKNSIELYEHPPPFPPPILDL